MADCTLPGEQEMECMKALKQREVGKRRGRRGKEGSGGGVMEDFGGRGEVKDQRATRQYT